MGNVQKNIIEASLWRMHFINRRIKSGCEHELKQDGIASFSYEYNAGVEHCIKC